MKLLGKIVAIVALLGTPAGVFGQLSPGSLANAHRDLDSPLRCNECHTFGAGAPVFKCIDCHAEIGERVSAKRGYHATVVDLAERGRDCASCHRDHIGRDFELVHWPNGERRFDHAEAGYPLVGKHARQQCRDCHQIEFIDINQLRKAKVRDASRTFLGLRTTCAACHQDEHQGQLGMECERCHGFDDFTTVSKFDHQATEFPIAGRHTGLQCAKCHLETNGYVQYAGAGFRECKTCHEDPHGGAFAQACSSCHVDAGWDVVRGSSRFDHSKTDFPLEGKHVGLSCSKCHAGADFKKPIERLECAQCHEDSHGGQFVDREAGSDCASCHNEEGFTPTTFTLDDHSLSDYPLTGKHASVECRQCHEPQGKETLYNVPFGACMDCHADAHDGQFAPRPNAGECADCHRRADGASNFENVEFAAAPVRCAECHDDVHAGQFDAGERRHECSVCHTNVDWNPTRFDHSKYSVFALDGAHETVPCGLCHTEKRRGEDFDVTSGSLSVRLTVVLHSL